MFDEVLNGIDLNFPTDQIPTHTGAIVIDFNGLFDVTVELFFLLLKEIKQYDMHYPALVDLKLEYEAAELKPIVEKVLREFYYCEDFLSEINQDKSYDTRMDYQQLYRKLDFAHSDALTSLAVGILRLFNDEKLEHLIITCDDNYPNINDGIVALFNNLVNDRVLFYHNEEKSYLNLLKMREVTHLIVSDTRRMYNEINSLTSEEKEKYLRNRTILCEKHQSVFHILEEPFNLLCLSLMRDYNCQLSAYYPISVRV